jgi:hypothetical protein
VRVEGLLEKEAEFERAELALNLSFHRENPLSLSLHGEYPLNPSILASTESVPWPLAFMGNIPLSLAQSVALSTWLGIHHHPPAIGSSPPTHFSSAFIIDSINPSDFRSKPYPNSELTLSISLNMSHFRRVRVPKERGISEVEIWNSQSDAYYDWGRSLRKWMHHLV